MKHPFEVPTVMRPCPLVPEVALAIADALTPLWEANAELPLPYWAVPWIGGQALARFVLDRPRLVAGKRVLDVGTGSGLVAIAAALAQAGAGAYVRAVDVDARALEAASRNAAANGVTITFQEADVLSATAPEDVILIGDLFYEPKLAARVVEFCERHPQVLLGDPGRAYFPVDRCEQLASYQVETVGDVEAHALQSAGVFRMTR